MTRHCEFTSQARCSCVSCCIYSHGVKRYFWNIPLDSVLVALNVSFTMIGVMLLEYFRIRSEKNHVHYIFYTLFRLRIST